MKRLPLLCFYLGLCAAYMVVVMSAGRDVRGDVKTVAAKTVAESSVRTVMADR